MTENQYEQPDFEATPETDWAFAPTPEQMQGDLAKIEQMLATTERLEELPELERSLLANTRFSFKFSQGSVLGQHKIMEYMRRQYPELSPKRIDEAFENILPQLAAYEKFQPPHKHTPNLGLGGPVSEDLRRRTIAIEYANITGDFAAIMKRESSTFSNNIENNDDTLELHELSNEQLLADITDMMLERDLVYVTSGRPGRITDTERFKSFYREYIVNQRRAPTPVINKMLQDVREFVRKLEIESPETIGIHPNRFKMLKFKQKELAETWEYKNFGQEFVPGTDPDKTYDHEAHHKTFHKKIYELRQAAINSLSKNDQLRGPLEINKADIRAKLDKDPNFVSMHDQLMQASMPDVEVLVSDESLDEQKRELLRKTLAEKLSSEIEQCDPQFIRDQPFREFIKPVLEHKFQHELNQQAVTERFQQTPKVSSELGATVLAIAARTPKTPIKSDEIDVVQVQPTPYVREKSAVSLTKNKDFIFEPEEREL